MKCLVTGGAGFIGRWVVKRLLDEGHEVTALDDLTNGRESNLEEFAAHPNFSGLVRGDVGDPASLRDLFAGTVWDAVFHLAASIHVQKSIDDPWPTFRNDAQGTFALLEACREQYFRLNGFDTAARHFDYEKAKPQLLDRRPRVACMSTCMVYQLAGSGPITEAHPYRPASPYAASKIGADMLALSYYYSYGLPVTVVRPFNTYGPFQKSNSEGGVVLSSSSVTCRNSHCKSKATARRPEICFTSKTAQTLSCALPRTSWPKDRSSTRAREKTSRLKSLRACAALLKIVSSMCRTIIRRQRLRVSSAIRVKRKKCWAGNHKPPLSRDSKRRAAGSKKIAGLGEK